MPKFHHIGLFVQSIDYGVGRLSEIITIVDVGTPIVDDAMLINVQFVMDDSGIRYELVSPNGLGNPVDEVLGSKKNILNHIAYTSSVFSSDIMHLRKKGCIPLGPPKKAKAFSGSQVIFFLTPMGFIYELIEEVIK
jgi:methylmalonyl-CoA/ethylmalonyl-CoA epimerase